MNFLEGGLSCSHERGSRSINPPNISSINLSIVCDLAVGSWRAAWKSPARHWVGRKPWVG
jgi:hypothetical protein